MKSATKERAPRTLHIELPPLPYAYDALAPVISKETLKLHHDKHHRKYVETTNQLLAKRASMRARSRRSCAPAPASSSTTPRRRGTTISTGTRSRRKGGKPSAAFMKKLQSDLGGWDKFATAYAEAANGQFGSGWAWLVVKNGKLAIVATLERRNAHGARHQVPARARRVGARLLRGLSERARELRRSGDQRAPQLGIRRAQPRRREIAGPRFNRQKRAPGAAASARGCACTGKGAALRE